MTDYQTKKGRLKKEKKVWIVDQDGNKFQTESNRLYRFTGDKDFRLADNDDFFGFNSNTLKLSLFEKFIGLIIAVWVIVFILQALQFIF